VRRKRLEAEKAALEDASRRMSIWPMIEAGEFSTISEGLTEADAAISQGKAARGSRGDAFASACQKIQHHTPSERIESLLFEAVST